MNVDYFRYLVLAGNFLNFPLCEIQLGAQCLLGEHRPLTVLFALSNFLLPEKLLHSYSLRFLIVFFFLQISLLGALAKQYLPHLAFSFALFATLYPTLRHRMLSRGIIF